MNSGETYCKSHIPHTSTLYQSHHSYHTHVHGPYHTHHHQPHHHLMHKLSIHIPHDHDHEHKFSTVPMAPRAQHSKKVVYDFD